MTWYSYSKNLSHREKSDFDHRGYLFGVPLACCHSLGVTEQVRETPNKYPLCVWGGGSIIDVGWVCYSIHTPAVSWYNIASLQNSDAAWVMIRFGRVALAKCIYSGGLYCTQTLCSIIITFSWSIYTTLLTALTALRLLHFATTVCFKYFIVLCLFLKIPFSSFSFFKIYFYHFYFIYLFLLLF